jgi:hypothetical protein
MVSAKIGVLLILALGLVALLLYFHFTNEGTSGSGSGGAVGGGGGTIDKAIGGGGIVSTVLPVPSAIVDAISGNNKTVIKSGIAVNTAYNPKDQSGSCIAYQQNAESNWDGFDACMKVLGPEPGYLDFLISRIPASTACGWTRGKCKEGVGSDVKMQEGCDQQFRDCIDKLESRDGPCPWTPEGIPSTPIANPKPRPKIANCGTVFNDNLNDLARGWYDISKQGVKNDYCRINRGADGELYTACQLAGSTDPEGLVLSIHAPAECTIVNKPHEPLQPGEPCYLAPITD